ncbi:MAG: hypothetical protein AAFX87_07195 [Bacteroidota bacterium]
MSSDKHDLVNKYLAAKTTVEEEEALFNSEDQPSGMKEWSTYVKQKRKKAPAHLNDKIWASIQTRKKRRQRFLMGLSGMAASIAIILAVVVARPTEDDLNDHEKEVLFNEAMSMFPDEKNIVAKKDILYEDDAVIIYRVSE